MTKSWFLESLLAAAVIVMLGQLVDSRSSEMPLIDPIELQSVPKA